MHELIEPDGIERAASYDRAELDRFVTEVAAEQARLQAEVDAVRARTRFARADAAARATRGQAELGALVMAVQAEMAVLEQEHRGALESIRAAAEREAARLLDAARAESDAVRRSASELASLRSRADGRGDPAGTASVCGEAARSCPETVDPSAPVLMGNGSLPARTAFAAAAPARVDVG